MSSVSRGTSRGLVCLATALCVLASACSEAEPPPRHVRIHDIQGPGHLSPMRGLAVADVPGVVTAVHDQGLWMQDLRPDDKVDTSEGIYVYLADQPDVKVGDTVTVSGTVSEVRTGGSGSGSLTMTQLIRPKLAQTGSADLPASIRLGQGGARIPEQLHTAVGRSSSTDLERGAHFDHGRNAIDAMETLEGMRVEIPSSVVIGPRDDQLPVWPASGVPGRLSTERGSVLEGADGASTGRVILDDTLSELPNASTGDTLSGSITGVWHYAGGNYALLPTATPQARPSGLRAQTATMAAASELSIAALDAEGLSTDSSGSTVAEFAALITQNLRRPDIVVLTGVGDDSGERDDGVGRAAKTFDALRAAVSADGGPRYDYRQIDPDSDADSSVPGDNPRTGFLFRPDRARFIDRPGATADSTTTVTAAQGRAELNHSPGRVAPADSAFDDTRKVIVGEFDVNGAPLFVLGLDLVARDAASPRFGRYQPPRTPSQRQRVAQAEAVHDFARRLGEASPTARVVTVGTVHDDTDSKPVRALTTDGVLRAAAVTLPERQRYSRLEDGLATLPDQAFTSPNVGSVGYQIVHTSAEFSDRITDRDPQLLRIRASAG